MIKNFNSIIIVDNYNSEYLSIEKILKDYKYDKGVITTPLFSGSFYSDSAFEAASEGYENDEKTLKQINDIKMFTVWIFDCKDRNGFSEILNTLHMNKKNKIAVTGYYDEGDLDKDIIKDIMENIRSTN